MKIKATLKFVKTTNNKGEVLHKRMRFWSDFRGDGDYKSSRAVIRGYFAEEVIEMDYKNKVTIKFMGGTYERVI